jgi:hypothetical protein
MPPAASSRAAAHAALCGAQRRLAAAEARRDPTAGARELVLLARSVDQALRTHARFSGETDVTVSAILASAAWARIRDAFAQAAERHPEAAAVLAEALETAAAMGAP